MLVVFSLLASACGSSEQAKPAATPAQQPAAASKPAASPATKSAPAVAASPKPVAGGAEAQQWPNPPEMTIDPNRQYRAVIETTQGTMTAELFAKEAPKTVNNFVFLSRQNFYNGVPFHRIIAGFMVQTGDPTGTGRGGPGYRFADELPRELNYERGTLAMANAGPNTQGSQFFICHDDLTAKGKLQKNYTIFGKLTDGYEVLEKIANTPVRQGPSGERSTPTEEVRIISVTIQEG